MKKQLLITLMDGTTLIPDWDKVIGQALGAPGPNGTLIGAPAFHESYIGFCHAIAKNGLVDDNPTNDYMKFIAPANIKQIEIIFNGAQEAKLIIQP